MKKQGFTIIELLVVVIVLGVLASVAVPKLFSLMSKAKVSELSFSAGTYIKLQEVHIHEHSKGGSWQSIGFKSPAGNSSGKANTPTFEYDATQTTYNWTATTIVALNSCKQGQKWFVNFSLESNTNTIKFWASSDDIGNCLDALTPNFNRLSTSAVAITTPGSVD